MSQNTATVGKDKIKETKSFTKFYGLPIYIVAALIAIVLLATYTGALPTNIVGAFALMMSIGVIFKEIGDRIPIWNTYIGGGVVLAFLGSAALVYFDVLPTEATELITWANSEVDFLTFFIVILITGSILSLERSMLIKSIAGYIPSILGAVLGAGLFGIGVGLLFGVTPSETMIMYVLPIMGGGNGAGAIPLSEIYQTVTGEPAASYYAFAIAILTIANIFAIISGGVLNAIGNKRTQLTGDKKTLMRNSDEFPDEAEDAKVTVRDYGGAMMLALTFYVLGALFSNVLLPTIFGVAIHQYAYMIIFVAIANALGIIPTYVKKATKNLQNFFTRNFILVIMIGVGAETDLGELFAAITFSNVLMALMIVIGAIVGGAVVGYLVGFYPIDTAVTAGLCMANRGGSGDIAVLGAADRMGLMAYAQLSSRLGGGMILIIASILFGALL